MTSNNGIIFLEIIVDIGFEEKYWRIDRFGAKKARIAGFTYPYSPDVKCTLCRKS